MTRAYLNKLLRSPLTYVGFAGIIALCFYCALMPGKMQDVVAQMGRFYNISIMRKIVYIFAAMVFAGNFADEWTNCVIGKKEGAE